MNIEDVFKVGQPIPKVVQQGLEVTTVFSDVKNLSNWEIKLIGKNGRTSSFEIIPMVEVLSASRRYFLEWNTLELKRVEYDYEISANGVLIDKGILRRK